MLFDDCLIGLKLPAYWTEVQLHSHAISRKVAWMDKKRILPACCIAAFVGLSLGAGSASARLPAKPAAQAAMEEDRPGISGKELWALTETKLFNGQVHRISLRMNQAVWDRLQEDEKSQGCSDTGSPKWAHVRDFTFNDIGMKDVAIKVLGEGSRCVPRVPFALSFGRMEGVYTRQGEENWVEAEYGEPARAAIRDRVLHGLESLNLHRSYNDSSAENDGGKGMLAREFVATWAAAKAEDTARTTLRGAPVYRTAYALVEFQLCAGNADDSCDNRFIRAYLIAEPIDKGFFRMRYDDEKPTFFSMANGCALRTDRGIQGFISPCLQPEYLEGKKVDRENGALQLKALGHLTGPGGLRSRIAAAESAPELGKVIDLDAFMNYAAFATTTGYWDSAYGNFNNDILYFHAQSGKWKIIVGNADNTFGDGNGGRGNPANSYSYAEAAGTPRMLFDKLFGISALDAQFRKHLGNYLSRLYAPDGSIKGTITDTRDRYIMKLNDELPSGERQDTQRAQGMLDYARQRVRVLRNQPRPSEP